MLNQVFFLFSLLAIVLCGQLSNFTVSPFNRISFVCNGAVNKFDFYIDTKDLFEEYTQATYTFSISQENIILAPNSTKKFTLNQTFSININYVFSTGRTSSVKYDTDSEVEKILNYFIKSDKGGFVFTLMCSEDPDILVNFLAFTFFPTTVKLKPLEFDIGYQLVSVPGYFSGVYVKYETFLNFATYFSMEKMSHAEIILSECIGSVNLYHFSADEFEAFLKNQQNSSNTGTGLVQNKNNSNKFIFKLHSGFNIFVAQAIYGVVFQYGMPSKAMIRLIGKLIDYDNSSYPFLKSTKIKYNYKFPEVLLNFSKIMLTDRLMNEFVNSTNNATMNSSHNTSSNISNNSNNSSPIKYKIIIAQDYLFLTIVSKCGLDVFENIPKNGNFQNINTYYKEIVADYAQNGRDILLKNTSNSDNTSNGTKIINVTDNLTNDTSSMESNKNSSTNNNGKGFLMKNDSSSNDSISNVTTNDDNNTSTNIADLKPFTLYDNGNDLNLVVNLDTRDYYFITALGYYSDTKNDTYFYYDPILIKDSRFGDEGLLDFGLILIIVGAIVFSLIMLFCFYKCMRRYINSTKKAKKEKCKKKKDKFSDQQKILFGKPQENLSDKAKPDRLSQILGPSDVKIAKII